MIQFQIVAMADESYPQKVPLNGSVVVPGQPPVTPSAPPNSSPQHSAFSQADGSPVRQAPKPAAPYRKAPDIVPFERRNWLIHWYYVKKEFESCKAVIQVRLVSNNDNVLFPQFEQFKF